MVEVDTFIPSLALILEAVYPFSFLNFSIPILSSEVSFKMTALGLVDFLFKPLEDKTPGLTAARFFHLQTVVLLILRSPAVLDIQRLFLFRASIISLGFILIQQFKPLLHMCC